MEKSLEKAKMLETVTGLEDGTQHIFDKVCCCQIALKSIFANLNFQNIQKKKKKKE